MYFFLQQKYHFNQLLQIATLVALFKQTSFARLLLVIVGRLELQ